MNKLRSMNMEDEFQPNWSTFESPPAWYLWVLTSQNSPLSAPAHTENSNHPSQDSAQFHFYHEIQSNGLNNLEFNVMETSISVTMPLIPNQILAQLAVLLWDNSYKFLRFSIFQL